MDIQCMSDRKNRTIYISDALFEMAGKVGKKEDRSASRIIEYALLDYFKKKGLEVPDPESTD